MSTPTVHIRVVMDHQGAGPIPVDLSWHDLVPCQVRMLVGGAGGIEWWIARALLTEGMRAWTGVGGVVVQPVGDMVAILLRTNKSHATLTAHRGDIEAFLEQADAVDPCDDLGEAGWQWLMSDLLAELREPNR